MAAREVAAATSRDEEKEADDEAKAEVVKVRADVREADERNAAWATEQQQHNNTHIK